MWFKLTSSFVSLLSNDIFQQIDRQEDFWENELLLGFSVVFNSKLKLNVFRNGVE